MLKIALLTLVLLTAANALAATAGAQEMDARETEILGRSLVDLGDVGRLQHVLAKARRGEPVVVGVIGGSITEGAKASAEEHRWANHVWEWWRGTFPGIDVELVNAGISATGSATGSHRVQEHLLKRAPDFVVVEFSVNDRGSPRAAVTLEGVLRQILKQPNHPAVMLLFMTRTDGTSVQEAHAEIGNHYGLPMVSFRDAMMPEVDAGRLQWIDIVTDHVHPNDTGHRYCGAFIRSVLDRTWKELPADEQLPTLPPLPAPKIGDTYEYTAMYNADTLTPTRNEGWRVLSDHPFGRFWGPAWQGTEPGNVLEFEVPGTVINLLYYRKKQDMGIAHVSVDGGPPIKLDGWFSEEWGYTPLALIAHGLDQGTHTVRVTVAEDKAPASNGHEFRIHAIMAAGLPK